MGRGPCHRGSHIFHLPVGAETIRAIRAACSTPRRRVFAVERLGPDEVGVVEVDRISYTVFALESGSRLGHYEIVEPLGAGGMEKSTGPRPCALIVSLSRKSYPNTLPESGHLKDERAPVAIFVVARLSAEAG